MKHYALIGKQLSHSYSKSIFEEHFGTGDATYDLVEMESLEGLRSEVQQLGLDGFNVTTPYKTDILPLLDELDENASRIEAVNTVRVEHDGSTLILKGYNTDAPAFAESISPLLQPHHQCALILGTGGAARAVACALDDLGLGTTFVSRQSSIEFPFEVIGYNFAYELADLYTVIVNATPVGMFPDCSQSPWQRPSLLGPDHLCFDLIYNPSPTRFLSEASRFGAVTKDGFEMLQLQAQKSWHIWNLE